MGAELPVSAKDLIPYTPAVYESEPEGERPVYMIAVPSLTGRPRWQRDVAAAGAMTVSEEKIRAFLRDAVVALLDGDAKTEALRDLDTVADLRARQAKADGNGHGFTDEEKAELAQLIVRIAELGEWAAREWPPYAELVAQQEYWWTMARLLAARHFVRGWKGVVEPCGSCAGSGQQPKAEDSPDGAEAAPCGRCNGAGHLPLRFKASRDGLVDQALLERLPRGDVFDVGLKAMMLMRLDQERRKN